MTSYRQFEANRRNALRSTGPKTDDGKRQSRANAVRHELAAETVVGSLEDAENYKPFEAAIISGYCAANAVERELVLRLASLLWRLRRAIAIETDLLEIQAEILRNHRNEFDPATEPVHRALKAAVGTALSNCAANGSGPDCRERTLTGHQPDDLDRAPRDLVDSTRQLTYCFLRLANLDSGVFERLNRHEAALWRQAVQTLLALRPIKQR
jgi:hypothetical protein